MNPGHCSRSDAFSRDAYDAVGDNPQELAGRLRDHVPVDKTPDLQGEKTIPLAAAYTGGTIAHYVDRMQYKNYTKDPMNKKPIKLEIYHKVCALNIKGSKS